MAEYKEVLVTYLDILGFRELVEKHHRTPDEILDLLKLMKEKADVQGIAISVGDVSSKKIFTATHAFSDLVIRQVEFEDENFISRLGTEMSILARIQFDLLTTKRCTLIRGGISRGKFHLSNDFVFGPAMVRSYELEGLAVFPRIVIDRDLLRRMSPENRTIWDYLITCGDDGIFFIDYLNAVMRRFLRPPNEAFKDKAEFILAHKEATEKKLEELSDTKESIRQKSLWLARYHNRVVEQAMAKDEEKKDAFSQLLIASDKLI